LCDDNLFASSRKASCSGPSAGSAEFCFLRLFLMTHTSHISQHRRLGRNLRSALLAVAVSAGALFVFGASDVSAAEALPVNSMAAEVAQVTERLPVNSMAVEVAQVTERLPVNSMAVEVAQAANRALADYEMFLVHGDNALYRSYAFHRSETARYAAIELGYSEAAMADAWASTSIAHQRAVLSAMTQVGVPYQRNTSIEGVGFDCSGLTTYAWAEPEVDLFRQSGVQISRAGKLDRSTARAGDLVHYPGHIMMYLGVDDAIIHSIQPGRTVELDTISSRRTNSVSWGDPTT